MPFFICLLASVIFLALQYFLSHWLIKIGWFYGYAWAMGGFIFIFFTFMAVIFKLFKLFKLDTNKNDILVKLSLILMLLSSFWLN